MALPCSPFGGADRGGDGFVDLAACPVRSGNAARATGGFVAGVAVGALRPRSFKRSAALLFFAMLSVMSLWSLYALWSLHTMWRHQRDSKVQEFLTRGGIERRPTLADRVLI